jgi:uncharacterized membrane protein
MAQPRATIERLGAFSDAVFAVIITIMVLELKPPDQPTFAAFFWLQCWYLSSSRCGASDWCAVQFSSSRVQNFPGTIQPESND